MKKSPHIPIEFVGTAALGERGQIVIPKEVRDQLDLQPGTKMVIALIEGGKIMMMPVERMRGFMQAMSEHFASVKKVLES